VTSLEQFPSHATLLRTGKQCDALADWQTGSHIDAALQYSIRKIGCRIIWCEGDALRETDNTNEVAEALMQQVFIEGGLIRKLWDVETPPIAIICSGSMVKAAAIVSAAGSLTTQSGAMPQRRAAAT